MNPFSKQAKSLFLEIVRNVPMEQWDDYLASACEENPELRQRVAELLSAHQEGQSFLAQPAVQVEATELTAVTEQPGNTIGPYKLLQQIGEGGMGVVYMAEQTEPVERRVALKIIKPGMDTRQVIARFEAERQALAMMDHPNIAKVLDAGTTDSGRPFFVMELVKGMPVTQYCDEQHLTPRERLELFVPICQAVQHAHQKGIIHRDLKPSNILIAQYDDKPVPKIIDFGVAKAVSHNLTEKTLFTQYGQIVGTIEYMSPEQAQFNQLDVDTRSDIYSLGVLLYELLTGETPFDKKRLRSAAFDELLRIIREEEPPKMSIRLSSSETLANTAINRKTEPKKLSLLVRGELDWIVMKALEKDRNRRYETANGFAADIAHYLNDEPVQACSPSAGYKFRKFARRNKGRLVTTSLLAIALLTTVGGVGWALRDRAAERAEIVQERETREAEIAREQEQRLIRTRTQLELILTDVDRLMQEQNWDEALSTVRRAEAVVTSGEADAATVQRVHELLKDLKFIDRLEQIRMMRATIVEGDLDNTGADREYALAFRDYGVDVDELAVETSINRLKARPSLASPLAAALDDWVRARRVVSKEEVARCGQLVAVARGIDPEPLRDRLRSTWGQPVTEVQDELHRMAESIDIRSHHPATIVSLAQDLARVNRSDSAIRLLQHAQHDYPADFWINFDLAKYLYDSTPKRLDEAVLFYHVALALRPGSTAVLNNLGVLLCDNFQEYDKAIAVFRRAIEIEPKNINAHAHHNLGVALSKLGKLDEAIASYEKAIGLDAKFAQAHSSLGLSLMLQKKLDEAIASCRQAIELDPKYAKAHNILGMALHNHGEVEEAIACYKQAIELDPKFADAYSNLGITFMEMGKFEEAIACYRTAIEIDPKHANAHANLGNVYYVQEKLDEAITCYRKAVEFDPRHASANIGLGNALAKKGWGLANNADPMLRDLNRALEAGKEAVEISPMSIQAWAYLGFIHYRAGNWHAGIEALKKSCELENGGDGGQWIVMSLAHAKLANEKALPEQERTQHQAEARRLYDQAAKQIDGWGPGDSVTQAVRDFRAEATELLGVKEEPK